MRTKITVVGAGNVGATAAHCCLRKKLGDVILIDVNENAAKGKAMDLWHASVLEEHDCVIAGTGDYADTANSDLIIVTAGITRKPGMSRNDLIATNMEIVSQVCREALKHSPKAVFIIVSNPVDVMCMAAVKATGLPPSRIVGLSGTLDSSRMRANIAAMAGVPADTVHGIIIGEHGDGMVPLPRHATMGGVPVSSVLSPEQMEEVRVKTINGGAGVVALLGYSAYYAPGIAIAVMAEAIIHDSGRVLPCSVYLNGQYGANGMFMCVPARINAGGVADVVELDLYEEEEIALAKSVANIRANLKETGLLN